MTSKRQATFPKALCDEMHLDAGDALRVERRIVDGKPVWILKAERDAWSWVGRGRRYAQDASHALDDIHESIVRGRLRERSGR